LPLHSWVPPRIHQEDLDTGTTQEAYPDHYMGSLKENHQLLLYEKPAQEMKNLINLRKTCKNASNET
jgi:hypothetical protein